MKKLSFECLLKSKIEIEIDNEVEVVRFLYGDKCIKIWYNQDTIQVSKLPNTCTDIVNEYTDIFQAKKQ